MASGREILASLDGRLDAERRELQELDHQFQRATHERMRLQGTETEHYRELARMHIEELSDPDLIDDLDAAGLRVRALLRDRETALAGLEARVAGNQERQQELEAERRTLIDREETAAEALDRQQAATQARLSEDAAYDAQLARARRLEETARAALEKTEQAEQDRLEKGKPYESDRLFMYLWERGFGTSRYRAWPAVRYLDGRIARLVRFDEARANYAMLLEIPLRLRVHAEAQREIAQAELEALEALERAAAEADGVPSLQATLADAQKQLAELDRAIEKQEEAYQALLAEQSDFAAGQDEYFRKAVRVMAAELRRESIVTLRRRALETPQPEDDTTVAALADVVSRREGLEESLADQGTMYEAHRRRLAELAEIRRQFKAEDFDAPHSEIRDSAMLATLLQEFMHGQLGRQQLWRAIRQRQRFRRRRANPHFGSAGLVRILATVGRGALRGGGFGRGGGGGLGGGGFRTGGGF